MSRSIEQWIDEALDPREQRLRQAVRTVLHAVSLSDRLHGSMLIKGGMLLAIRYGSDRFTRDVDFSTDEQPGVFDAEAFVDELDTHLAEAVELLRPKQNLDCRVQGHEMKPARPDASFPTLRIRIAHAPFGSPEHRRLSSGNGPSVLSIDHSLNEHQMHPAAEIELGDETSVQAYSLPDLIGEKYRAMLQQGPRDRVRGQDVYDVHQLLADPSLSVEPDDALRAQVHVSLVQKSASRDIVCEPSSMRSDELVKRLRQGYEDLGATIPRTLAFEAIHERVACYYESLPWR